MKLTPEQRNFNDLATVAIYHYADCAIENKAKCAARRLVKQGIIKSLDDADNAYEQYETFVKEYAEEHLPEAYTFQYDYWGAKCYANNKGWNAPKNGLFYAGDSCGRIMFFDSFQALKEYTERTLAEIAQLTPA